ncbi:Rhombotin-2 [Anopheles sinensis]|uniref:Rhombotin-2 n=1 Tax=Anopheles sinensis TaxID=74873 RepID=A0A084VE64_ANOSI|nr:Rhombotin-2 [Anopheles sinensis]
MILLPGSLMPLAMLHVHRELHGTGWFRRCSILDVTHPTFGTTFVSAQPYGTETKTNISVFVCAGVCVNSRKSPKKPHTHSSASLQRVVLSREEGHENARKMEITSSGDDKRKTKTVKGGTMWVEKVKAPPAHVGHLWLRLEQTETRLADDDKT